MKLIITRNLTFLFVMAIIMSIVIVESESNQEKKIENDIDDYPGFNIYEKILILKFENYYENYNLSYNESICNHPKGIFILKK